MSQQTISAEAGSAHAPQGASDHAGRRLGALLCWAVVFADIGTSVYYVPGILFLLFAPNGHLAGFFVTLTMGAFVLLAIKYAEVSVRFPEGGGVVTVSARALNPWMGALGGMFILVDYFLTAAISSLSGLQYLQVVLPPIKPFVLGATIVVLVLLGVLNWWGIRESAMVSLYIAIAAFISDIVVIVAILATVPFGEIVHLITTIFRGTELTPVVLVTGFAGAFLAFSGLESISQLSPVMQRPRSRTVTIALSLVVLTVGFTSPLLTILSTTLLDGKHNYLLAHPVANIDPNQFISQLGAAAAGPVIGVATAVIASALLIFASNTAIIGTYHVFLALSRMSFFPKAIEKRDPHRDTPIISIALATAIPIAILLFANGQIDLLGQLYAFGLLGAFSLTSLSLDWLRFRERRGGKQITLHEEDAEIEAAERAREARLYGQPALVTTSAYEDEDEDEDELVAVPTPSEVSAREGMRGLWRLYWRRYWPTVNFGLGLLTTVLVLIAWVTNLVTKHDATIFGSSLTVLGMAVAIVHYNSRRRAGDNVVQPSWAMSALPDSVFAIAHTGSPYNDQIIESAFNTARGRKVLLLFLSSRIPPQPRFMQINDPALRDDEAQDAFRLARRLSQQTGTPTDVYYRIGGVASAAALWRVARSQEVVTDRETARAFSASVAPTYIRYRQQGEASVAHIIILPREEAAGAVTPGLIPAVPSRRVSPTPRPPVPLYPEGADLSDETWNEEDLRTFDETYAGPGGGVGAKAGPAAVSPQEEPTYGEPPRPDHEHVGDTKPRHRVKIMQSILPSQSGVIEAPRPAPKPKPATRMSEPTPLESDDDEWYYWNGEDLVRRDDAPLEGQNGAGKPGEPGA